MGESAGSGGISLLGLGLKGAGIVSEGIQKKTAAQVQSIQLKTAAEAGRVRALQTDAAYREDMNATMQNLGAIRSAQNVGFDSPTSFALYDKAETNSNRARQVAVSNERLKALGLDGDAALALQNASMQRTIAGLKLATVGITAGQEMASFAKNLGKE